ncbi:MAG: hypothetical protein HY078_16370 [Elusimicrobia bacterium]|nr:hypothetical protein [Elusimicrobiota bacterium]
MKAHAALAPGRIVAASLAALLAGGSALGQAANSTAVHVSTKTADAEERGRKPAPGGLLTLDEGPMLQTLLWGGGGAIAGSLAGPPGAIVGGAVGAVVGFAVGWVYKPKPDKEASQATRVKKKGTTSIPWKNDR